jgi:hypothetical protein
MDLKFAVGNQTISRSGREKRPQLTFRQPLLAGKRRLGSFIAVIRDPETSEVLAEVPIWTSTDYGESVDLTVEWKHNGNPPREE